MTYPIISIDPGDKHVGVAVFFNIADGGAELWQCNYVDVMTPAQFVPWFNNVLDTAESTPVVVLESYGLYGGRRGAAQIGSAMHTSQLIGYITWHLRSVTGTEPVLSPPSAKMPTRGYVELQNIKMMAKLKTKQLTGCHADDAELHAIRYIAKTLGAPIAPPAEG